MWLDTKRDIKDWGRWAAISAPTARPCQHQAAGPAGLWDTYTRMAQFAVSSKECDLRNTKDSHSFDWLTKSNIRRDGHFGIFVQGQSLEHPPFSRSRPAILVNRRHYSSHDHIQLDMSRRVIPVTLSALLLAAMFLGDSTALPTSDTTRSPRLSRHQLRGNILADVFRYSPSRRSESDTPAADNVEVRHLDATRQPDASYNDNRRSLKGTGQPAEDERIAKTTRHVFRDSVAAAHRLAKRSEDILLKYTTIGLCLIIIPSVLLGLGLASIAIFGFPWKDHCGKRRKQLPPPLPMMTPAGPAPLQPMYGEPYGR